MREEGGVKSSLRSNRRTSSRDIFFSRWSIVACVCKHMKTDKNAPRPKVVHGPKTEAVTATVKKRQLWRQDTCAMQFGPTQNFAQTRFEIADVARSIMAVTVGIE